MIQSQHFINRELSWLEFNARVLEEAQDPSTPLLERVKFLSIFSFNLDEFFMVRVAGLRQQAFAAEAPQDFNPDGKKAITQLREICLRTQQLVTEQYKCWSDSVLPALQKRKIGIHRLDQIKDTSYLDRFFQEAIFPIITPMAIDPSHPRPRYHNRGLYIAIMMRRKSGIGPKRMFAVVQIPSVLPRLVPVDAKERNFVLLEDLVSSRLNELFGGHEIQTYAAFRITRDSDLDIIEQESDDMLRMIEERLKERRRLDAVRLEIAADADDELVQLIVEQEVLKVESRPGIENYTEVYRIPGPVDLTGLMGLYDLSETEDLRDPTFIPLIPTGLRRHGEDLFSAIRRRDILLHHPYDDFSPVVEFVTAAAKDPNVLAIKQTLYRTSGDSPIIKALIEATESGKQVTALVELKARFDEAANVSWARKLEQSGAHVVYGLMDLKTHCKVSMVVRREHNIVKRYVHLSTGNYNPSTAKFYTDFGLFTADEDVAADVSALFNLLTGYSQGYEWRKLVVAPMDLHRRTIELIDEQTQKAKAGKPARIFAKLNSLVDHTTIEALYAASQAGVSIDLVVRGICCLKPGIKGISENISVRSIVDRFLEHTRVFVFGTDSDCQIFLSSADWMPRNFYRRVEAMFPVEQPSLRKVILNDVIPAYMHDNVKARVLNSNGTYSRIKLSEEETAFRSQTALLNPALIRVPPTNPAASVTAAAKNDQNGSRSAKPKKKTRAKQ